MQTDRVWNSPVIGTGLHQRDLSYCVGFGCQPEEGWRGTPDHVAGPKVHHPYIFTWHKYNVQYNVP